MTKRQKRRNPGRSGTRYDIRCPVTVLVRSRLNRTAQIEGELWEISEDWARLLLDKPLQRATEVLLFVHFRHPRRGVTTIRFQGVVERSRKQPRFEVTVRFESGGQFVANGLQELSKSEKEGVMPIGS